TAQPGSSGTLGSAHPADGTGTIPYMPAAGACSESTEQWTAGVVPAEPACTGDHRINDYTGVTYDLPISGKAMRIAGTSMARLFVSTSRTDAFLATRLEDVAPDGSVTPLSSGWQALSLRKVDPKKS